MTQERSVLSTHLSPADDCSRMRLELFISPDTREVPAARQAVQRVCEDVGFSDDDCADLDLALGEALANAVLHGASAPQCCQSVADVLVCAWDFQSQLIVEVRDCGCGFDPPLPPYAMPAPDMDATHGRGLPLMELLTDALIVCRGDIDRGGSSIFLIKTKPDAA